jgi:hypothetical protein
MIGSAVQSHEKSRSKKILVLLCVVYTHYTYLYKELTSTNKGKIQLHIRHERKQRKKMNEFVE